MGRRLGLGSQYGVGARVRSRKSIRTSEYQIEISDVR
jgi:hypothetical protein